MEKIIGDCATEIRMTSDEAKSICRLGQMDKCCAFLVCGGKGFECIRLSYPANCSIFSRLEKGTMNAKGQGGWKGCGWFGKIENSEDRAETQHPTNSCAAPVASATSDPNGFNK